jgi:hypothetical protein
MLLSLGCIEDKKWQSAIKSQLLLLRNLDLGMDDKSNGMD